MQETVLAWAADKGAEVRRGDGVLRIVAEGIEAVPHILDCLVFGLGEVHWADQAPLGTVGNGAELGGTLLHDVPMPVQEVEAFADGRAD